jgi:monofunctional biosynthetic peptidoglycan transglycosylase
MTFVDSRPRRSRLPLVVALVTAVLVLAPVVLLAVWTTTPPISTPMLARWATGAPVVRVWRPIEAIDRRLVASVIASEDNGFCRHAGVDWRELGEVIETEGGPRRGASTITMQLAKNLFLWPGRSYVRKALEIPLALAIDLLWSKRRILEAYLNIAEWGPNGEFGIEAGARRAFGKSAARLDTREAALLAVMLPNPHTRDARRPSANLRRVATIVRMRAVEAPEFTACLDR